MTETAWQPDAGDLIWTDLNRTNGREQAGRRPALVVSARVFTANTGMAVVCPIVSRARSVPTSVVLPAGLPVSGEILVSHIRSIDVRERPVTYTGASVGRSVSDEVRAKLAALLMI